MYYKVNELSFLEAHLGYIYREAFRAVSRSGLCASSGTEVNDQDQ